MRCDNEEIFDGLKCSLSVFSADICCSRCNSVLYSFSQSQNVNHILHLITSQHMLCVCTIICTDGLVCE